MGRSRTRGASSEEIERVLVGIQAYLSIPRHTSDSGLSFIEDDESGGDVEKDLLEDLWERIQVLSINGWKVESGNWHHNLDLSLGISAPSVAQNGSNDTVDFHFHNTAESSAYASVGVQPLHVPTIVAKHPPMLSGVYPATLLPFDEGKAMPKKAEAVSSTDFSNWGWPMQGDG